MNTKSVNPTINSIGIFCRTRETTCSLTPLWSKYLHIIKNLYLLPRQLKNSTQNQKVIYKYKKIINNIRKIKGKKHEHIQQKHKNYNIHTKENMQEGKRQKRYIYIYIMYDKKYYRYTHTLSLSYTHIHTHTYIYI